MTLYFNTEIAQDVGLTAAVIFEYIMEGVSHSMVHREFSHEGVYWTRQSVAEVALFLPFFTEKQIRSSLNELVSNGYLKSGCFNKDPRDRTKWYTNGEKGRFYDFSCK